MHISDLIKNSQPSISLEFYPPNTVEGWDRLKDGISLMKAFRPTFVSVTYGAGGSTRDATMRLVEHFKHHTSWEPVPHLTCVCHTRGELEGLLERYARLGVDNVLALRGDVPRGRPWHDHRSDDCVHAIDLVKLIQGFNRSGRHPASRGVGIGVAGFPEGHPETPNRLLEIEYLKAKVDAGADYICTQLFFDNRDFHDFRERCELAGIRVPILAGILPVTSMRGLNRIVGLSGRARVPARLLKELQRVQDDADAVWEIGIHHATEQVADLIHAGVAGVHIYTLNQAGPTLEILKRLGRLLKGG